MSSWISTVLPTPAPPKSPTLPPLMYGAIRSTHLRPVSKISIFGERSRKAGGSRWIGQRSVSAGISPFSSIDWPITFHRRPRVGCPTGTEIGAPVSTTSTPRARPSVESIATARTRSSPRCCCTSATSVPPSSSISRAVRISGRPSGNTASTTTPLISMILPTLRPVVLVSSGMRLRWKCRWTERAPAPAAGDGVYPRRIGARPRPVSGRCPALSAPRHARRGRARQTSEVTKFGITSTPSSVRGRRLRV